MQTQRRSARAEDQGVEEVVTPPAADLSATDTLLDEIDGILDPAVEDDLTQDVTTNEDEFTTEVWSIEDCGDLDQVCACGYPIAECPALRNFARRFPGATIVYF